ncbi:hypothetical protein [Aquincola sp. J276]|uniref:hypothetical protein n=1 Tax=Aquincola sp. J276 TaxID=2898432 RepID=UPI002150E798|nr:hypothetical protein [Aquincola sp. J276]MCR5865228.1 hypothetical protein [Aquincola sp. J276]
MTKPTFQALGALAGQPGTTFTEADVAADVPDLAAELHDTEIDAKAFAVWLQPLLVEYRVAAAAMALMGQRAAVVRWLEAAAAQPEQALGDGRLQHPPAWHAEPALWHAARRSGLDWDDLVAAGHAPLAAAVLRAAADMLRAGKSRRGRRTSRSRDLLLNAVVQRLRVLGLGAGDAAHRAAGILSVCAVPVPQETTARAARRAWPRAETASSIPAASPSMVATPPSLLPRPDDANEQPPSQAPGAAHAGRLEAQRVSPRCVRQDRARAARGRPAWLHGRRAHRE